MLKKFIPNALRANREIYSSICLILDFDVFIIFASLVLLPVFHFIGFEIGLWFAGFALLASSIFPFVIKFTADEVIIANYFALCTVITCLGLIWFSGGIHSAFLFLFLSIPPISYIYMKRKHAFAWSCLVAILFSLLAIAEWQSLVPKSALSDNAHSISLFLSFSFVTTFFVFMVKNYRRTFYIMNQKLKKKNAKINATNLELERFAAIASHDLKNPVRNISSFIALLRKRHGDALDEQGIEFTNIIERNADQAWRLIEDILEYSKTTSPEIKKERIELDSLLSGVRMQLLQGDQYNQAKITVDPMPVIHGDETKVLQIFQNLVENGLKYNRSDVPEVCVRYYQRNKNHHFEIVDNGIGIEAQHLSKVFEMFKRLHNQSEFEGTGIGLAICHKVINQMGGNISLISMPGRGSTFRIELPGNELDEAPKSNVHRTSEVFSYTS